MKYLSQFLLFMVAVAVLLGLQYQYWLGENGRSEHAALLQTIDKQQRLNDNQMAQNNVLSQWLLSHWFKVNLADLSCEHEHKMLSASMIQAFCLQFLILISFKKPNFIIVSLLLQIK